MFCGHGSPKTNSSGRIFSFYFLPMGCFGCLFLIDNHLWAKWCPAGKCPSCAVPGRAPRTQLIRNPNRKPKLILKAGHRLEQRCNAPCHACPWPKYSVQLPNRNCQISVATEQQTNFVASALLLSGARNGRHRVPAHNIPNVSLFGCGFRPLQW